MAVKPEVALKNDHDLHVALIMKQEGLTKAKAILTAYKEGLGGLTTRLGGK